MSLVAIVWSLGLWGGTPEKAASLVTVVPRPPVREGPELAVAVQALLTRKCAECHGATARPPRGSFGYVTDLRRVAVNPDLVAPFRPEASRLWELVRDGRMPPARARSGPLTTEQKELIRTWIEGGASAAAAGPAGRAFMAVPAPEEGSAVGPSPAEHLLGWLGRFHILIVHFPIALLVAAAAGELWAVWGGLRAPSPAVRFCVLLGGAGALAGVVLGWLHATFNGYANGASQALALHRWIGTAAGGLAVGILILSEVDARRGARSRLFRAALLLGALLVSVAGHLGGTLVYGAGFLDW